VLILADNKGVWLDPPCEDEHFYEIRWPSEFGSGLGRKRALARGIETELEINQRDSETEQWWSERGFSVIRPRPWWRACR